MLSVFRQDDHLRRSGSFKPSTRRRTLHLQFASARTRTRLTKTDNQNQTLLPIIPSPNRFLPPSLILVFGRDFISLPMIVRVRDLKYATRMRKGMGTIFSPWYLVWWMIVVGAMAGSQPNGVVDATWIDPDTTITAMTTKALSKGDNREYQLIFSDEFEQSGRTFGDGNDPRWTALHKNDCESFGYLYCLCFLLLQFCLFGRGLQLNTTRTVGV